MVICLVSVSRKSRYIFLISSISTLSISLIIQFLVLKSKIGNAYEFHTIELLDKFPISTFITIFADMIGLFLSIVFHICLLDAVNSQKSSTLRKGRNEFFIYPIYTVVISALFILTSTTMTARFSIEFKHRLTNILVDKYLEYNQCRDSRRFVDGIHIHYSCCGVESFDDFIDLSNIEGYDKELAPQTQINSCSNWEYCSLPLSCCKSALCTNIGELFKNPRNSTKISIEFYHQTGCLSVISNNFLFLKISTWHIILLCFVIVLHVVAGFLTQLTLTGYASLKESGLPEDEDSYSWILDFGAPRAEECIDMIKNEKSSGSENETTKRESEKNDLDTEKGSDNRLSEVENRKRSDLENEPIKKHSEKKDDNDEAENNKESRKNPSDTAVNAKKMIGKILDKVEEKLESNKEEANDLTSCGPSKKNDTKTSKSTEREPKNKKNKKTKKKTPKPKKKAATKKKTQSKKPNKGGTKKKEKKEPKKSKAKGKKK